MYSMYVHCHTYPCISAQCVVRERAERRQRQTVLSNQQLMLRQSLLQNTELKERLSQIHVLATGLDPSVSLSSGSLKTPRPRTPASHSQSFTGSIGGGGAGGGGGGGSSLPRFGAPGKSLSRFDSFVSVRSTISETFFDALDDVRTCAHTLHIHTHTHTHTHTHSLCHSLTLVTLPPPHSYSLTLSQLLILNLLTPHHFLTFSPFHITTSSHSHPLTLLVRE